MGFEQCRASVVQGSVREHHSKHLLCARPWGENAAWNVIWPWSGINAKGSGLGSYFDTK